MSVQVCVGDCIEEMRKLEPDSVDCVVTSPPYWGLRDYGVAGQLGLEWSLADHIAADRLRRNALLIELNPEYAEIARQRVSSEMSLLDGVAWAPSEEHAA